MKGSASPVRGIEIVVSHPRSKKSNSQHFIGIKDAIHVGQVQSVPHLSNGEQSSFVEQVDLS